MYYVYNILHCNTLFIILYIGTWSWNVAEPNAQIQANTKYVSYTSLVVSGGQLTGVRRQSSNVHNICICVISGMGVIIFNLIFSASKQVGTYFSNSTNRAAFSVALFLVSIQLETYGFQPRSEGFK